MQYLRSNQPNNLVVCSKKAQMLRIYMYDSMAGYTDIDDSVNVVAFCNSISLQDGHRISSTDGLPRANNGLVFILLWIKHTWLIIYDALI